MAPAHWNYTYSSYPYSGNVYFALDSVILPDTSTWQLGGIYTLVYQLGVGYGTNGCDAQFFPSGTPVGTIVHPTGAIGTFTLQGMVHGRSDVPYNCALTPTGGRYNPRTRYFYTLSLIAKSISGPGLESMTWRYAYGPPNASWAPCESPCLTSKTVSVTDPDGDVTRYTYGNRYRISEGRIEQVDHGWNGASALRTVKTRYSPPGAGPYPATAGHGGESITDGEALARFMPADQVETTQQGVLFKWTADAFDEMARVTKLTRSSSLGTTRSERTAYSDNPAKWVLGQVESVTESTTGTSMVANVYHPTAATLTSVSHFGHPDASMTYNPDGTLATRQDGNNHVTRFYHYKRGIPQDVSYPDNSAESAVVENIGTISSMTNAAGFTTNYDYDAMGRLSLIRPPTDPGIEWSPTKIDFAPVASNEFGLDAGHWRQDVSTGKGITSTYFDALWRPVYTMSYDAGNLSGSAQVVKRTYDAAGRTTFTSYPGAYDSNLDIGVSTEYDALGRPGTSRADSELGQLVSGFTYGSAFTRTHTDARGHSSTSRFQVFDTPSEEAVVAIAAPLGLDVAIARDLFGKPSSITRSGDGASATRRYVYDQFERLCKTIEPETGGETVDYDGANNIRWRAPGLALTSPVCDRASVAGAAKISFIYDPMNRVKSTTYGDGASAISRTYTPDGLPFEVTSGGATWTISYNHRRLPVTQVLNFSGQNYTLSTAYDANGHVSQLRYPSENNPVSVQSIAFAPDALGRPTQAGSFATGVRYYPNGAIAGFTYGNGKVHTMTQNARKLPERSTDSGALQDRFTYDQNGNVTVIADELQNISTRILGYDALDRLETANAPGMWGAARYGYDVLDNIRTSTVGNRISSYQYGARNLLDQLNSTAPAFGFGYAYDARGNVIQRGNQAFVFDLGNRLKSAPNRDTYAYDGFGRRVQTKAVDGTVTISVYSPAGQLLYTRRSGGPDPAASTEYIYLHQHQIAEVKR
jgi:YD repeat-containing protein